MKKILILIILCILQIFILVTISDFDKFTIIALAITSFDIFTAGESGGGEISVGGEDSFLTGIPPEEEEVSGGGGGGRNKIYNFELNKGFFSVKMKKGENYQQEILVTNTGTEDLVINISILISKDFVFVESKSFLLKKGETKTIKFDMYVSEKENSEVYIGKIIFNYADIDRIVNFVLDVQDKVPLFDIKTTILKKYVFPGGKVKANIFILNLGDLKNIDVELEYHVRDFDNNTYSSKKESFKINDSFEGEIFLETPKDIKIGDYIFYSKVSYKDITANSYDTFSIEKLSYIMWILILAINIVLIIFTIIGIIFSSKNKKEPVTNFQYQE